jgi:hypothetical protein
MQTAIRGQKSESPDHEPVKENGDVEKWEISGTLTEF